MGSYKKGTSGFTLVEVMIATAVFSILILTAGGFLVSLMTMWKKQKQSIEAMQSVRWAEDLITSEVRHSTFTSIPAWSRISIVGGDTITFGRDMDGDNTPEIEVSYRVQAGTLQRRQRNRGSGWPTWQIVAENIITNPGSAPFFANSGGVAVIEFTVSINNQPYTLRTAVRPHNN